MFRNCGAFVVHCTATTDIYTYCHTLSLHYALPICLQKDDVALDIDAQDAAAPGGIPAPLRRQGAILAHPVFSSIQSETDMLRYLRKLADKDLALDRSMIPLGSCTMKLNATAEMIPITWPEFALIHPYAPADQSK